MRKIGIAIFTGCMISTPAVFFLAFVVMPTQGEYFYLSYAVMGIVFLGGSFLVGILISHTFYRRASMKRITLFLFSGVVIAWFLSLTVLAVLSLTPLCVGQDNGDGNNDIMLCMLQYGLFSAIYTPPGILLMGLISMGASWFICRDWHWVIPKSEVKQE